MPAQDFPRGLVSRKINWLTGNLANGAKDKVTVEKYWRGKSLLQATTQQLQAK